MLPGDRSPGNHGNRLQNSLHERLQLINAGTAPENITGAVRRFRPDWILLVDAIDAGLPPGSISWLDPQAIEGFSASTHTLPLQVVAQYLGTELLCPVDLIGIQSQSLEFAAPLTPSVENAANQVAASLLRILRDEA